MKISICIPVYNFDVRELVESLRTEILTHNHDAEILLIDDNSKDLFKALNTDIEQFTDQFIYLEKNIGRSKIRNLFLDYANGEFLLFLDCDAKVTDKNFIKNYLDFLEIKPVAKAIYGGFVENNINNLRSFYSRNREILPLQKRVSQPYTSFRGINFIIDRQVLIQNKFDENIAGYGYEDFIFAQNLKQNGIKIFHTENAALHSETSTNQEFIDKAKSSIFTLKEIILSKKFEKEISEIRLVRIAKIIKNLRLNRIFLIYFRKKKADLESKLLNNSATLRQFDIYRLGLLLESLK